jgi:hypothetical protein
LARLPFPLILLSYWKPANRLGVLSGINEDEYPSRLALLDIIKPSIALNIEYSLERIGFSHEK